MSVAILVPVLNRPHRVEPLLQSIAEATDVPYRVIFAASDHPTIDELNRLHAWYITDEGGDEGSWPKRINRLYKEVNEPYVFCGADDLSFRPGWFQAAMRLMETVDGVVAVNDLYNTAGVHFLISRNYIETFGGVMNEPGVVMCEEFRHAYCDDYARSTAMFHHRWGGVANDAIVEHLHTGAGKAPMDDTYRLGESFMGRDLATYQSMAHLWATT